MIQVRVIVEYRQADAPEPVMRWERTGQTPSFAAGDPFANGTTTSDTFELLGRAFEVAQREEAAPFPESLAAFFRGAMVAREDLAQVLALMDHGQ